MNKRIKNCTKEGRNQTKKETEERKNEKEQRNVLSKKKKLK